MALGFPGDSAGKESTCNAGDLGSIPEWERSPGEGNSHPLQYSGLENPMDCIPMWSQSWTQLSNFHTHTNMTPALWDHSLDEFSPVLAICTLCVECKLIWHCCLTLCICVSPSQLNIILMKCSGLVLYLFSLQNILNKCLRPLSIHSLLWYLLNSCCVEDQTPSPIVGDT